MPRKRARTGEWSFRGERYERYERYERPRKRVLSPSGLCSPPLAKIPRLSTARAEVGKEERDDKKRQSNVEGRRFMYRNRWVPWSEVVAGEELEEGLRLEEVLVEPGEVAGNSSRSRWWRRGAP